MGHTSMDLNSFYNGSFYQKPATTISLA